MTPTLYSSGVTVNSPCCVVYQAATAPARDSAGRLVDRAVVGKRLHANETAPVIAARIALHVRALIHRGGVKYASRWATDKNRGEFGKPESFIRLRNPAAYLYI
jgi:hypothetical protein